MSTYAIGDVHGCNETLGRLLGKIDFDAARDRLWFVGDLVNGGPDSLEVLRRVREFGDRARVVLGNHDLHLLAVASGGAEMRESDNFGEVLEAPDADELLEWLRHRPLLYRADDTALVHAGLLPDWSVERALDLAAEVETTLQSDDWTRFLDRMYGNEPRGWDDGLDGVDRLRVVVNATTRMRTLTSSAEMDFAFTGEREDVPEDRTPWFEFEDAAWRGNRIVFGHWSALGYHRSGRIHGLDSGCRWGRSLSALRLGDEELIQVPSERTPPA